jgi:uncharacterized BrkB/YihY/UPF0761 family membrane protein
MSNIQKHQKEILIGLIVGLISNLFGVLLYILIFSPLDLQNTLLIAFKEAYLGRIIGLGALLNLAAFFGFLKLKKNQRAKGVLMGTLVAALFILALKITGL